MKKQTKKTLIKNVKDLHDTFFKRLACWTTYLRSTKLIVCNSCHVKWSLHFSGMLPGSFAETGYIYTNDSWQHTNISYQKYFPLVKVSVHMRPGQWVFVSTGSGGVGGWDNVRNWKNSQLILLKNKSYLHLISLFMNLQKHNKYHSQFVLLLKHDSSHVGQFQSSPTTNVRILVYWLDWSTHTLVYPCKYCASPPCLCPGYWR